MKKIPTLFKRTFENHRITSITDEVTPGMEWVLNGESEARIKVDGSCCAIINGKFYKRYDAKHGKKPPEGAIPCCAADEITGHHPHWVLVDPCDKSNKWFVEAYFNFCQYRINTRQYANMNATYEAIGEHFQGNPYNLHYDTLIAHEECQEIEVERTFEGIREFLQTHNIEGIVFWKDGEPRCKIKRTDFGFEFPMKMIPVDLSENYDLQTFGNSFVSGGVI